MNANGGLATERAFLPAGSTRPPTAGTPDPANGNPLKPKPKFKLRRDWRSQLPPEMLDSRQWVCWKWVCRDKRWTKVLFQPRKIYDDEKGRLAFKAAKSNDPETWGSLEEVSNHLICSKGFLDGPGFVFSPSDPYTGWDLDNCLNADGTLKAWAKHYIDRLSPSYYETSPSGHGLKGIVLATLPGKGKKLGGLGPEGDGAVELYDRGRFFTITGVRHPDATPEIQDRSVGVLRTYSEIKERAKNNTKGASSNGKPSSGRNVQGGAPAANPDHKSRIDDLPDEELLKWAHRAKNGAKFTALYAGDKSGYPSASEADFALLVMLAYWTGGDAARVERLFGGSGLASREKWVDRPDYRATSITNAIDCNGGNAPDLTEWTLADWCIGSRTRKPPAEARWKPSQLGRDDVLAPHSEGGEVIKPRPDDREEQESDPNLFSNYVEEEGQEDESGKAKIYKVPCRVEELDSMLGLICPGWPKRVGEDLFLETLDHKPLYLSSATRFFAWLDTQAQVDWGKGERFITQERFYEHCRMTVEHHECIETLPHWPPIQGVYYMHREVERGDGQRLNQFLDFFCPATKEDRELMLAMIMTPFWGGSPGSRPAWLITGPDNDPEQGRGTGKTTFLDIVSDELLDGYLDVSPNEDMESIKTRLFSDSGLNRRMIRLDNVKTLRFSWGDLEKMITSPTISGKRLYRGEGRRPNTLVWGITLNGASLSKDMAQRCIVIKLNRPTFKATWEHDVRDFARKYRWEILGDVRRLLEDERGIITPATRWAAWEAGVLAQTGMLKECQKLIIERQGSIDDDASEKNLVIDHFAECLRNRKHSPDGDCILIPSKDAAEWLSDALRKHFATNAASTYLNGIGIPQLSKCNTRDARGWIWRGIEAAANTKPSDLHPIAWEMTIGK